MGLKKRSKVSAEFSMSSLTDIIFLLLIFFMLTSSLVAPNSLNLKLPGSSNASVVMTESRMDAVRISRNGNYYLNNRRMSTGVLESELSERARGSRSKYTFTIAFDQGTPTEYVVAVMDIALRIGADGILKTPK